MTRQVAIAFLKASLGMPIDLSRCCGRKRSRIALAMLISTSYGIPGRVQLIYTRCLRQWNNGHWRASVILGNYSSKRLARTDDTSFCSKQSCAEWTMAVLVCAEDVETKSIGADSKRSLGRVIVSNANHP